MRRRLLVILVAAVPVLALLYWAFRPQPVAVDLAAARVAPMTVTVDQQGTTRVIDRYQVDAPVAGYARRTPLRPGNAVEQGQVLVEIEPLRPTPLDPRLRAEARARVERARSALAAAEAAYGSAQSAAELARAELVRAQKLAAAGDLPQARLEQAQSEARQAEAAERSARFQVDVGRHELEAAQAAADLGAAAAAASGEALAVRAPVAGQVLAVQHESAGVVQPGQPLLEVGDPRRLEVMAEVLSADAVRIRPGMPVRLTRWGGAGVLEAVVRTVEPSAFTKVSALGVEEQRVRVIAELLTPAPARTELGDNYRVQASFVLWHDPDVLQVPEAALFRRGEAWAVFVFEAGHARLREVEVGRRADLRAQILAGLEAGEVVIEHPPAEVEDGTAVVPRA